MRGLITASELASIKASGTVTKIVDATRREPIQPEGVRRLVYGFSTKGVFNRPVLIERGDFASAVNIFGSRDRELESNKSFFHRSLEITLREGAVLALNLLKTNNDVDQNGEPTTNADVADYVSLSLSPQDENGDPRSRLYASYFAKDRFWVPDQKYLLATRVSQDENSILNFSNTSQRKYTILVKKAQPLGFDVTVKEWYGDADVPEYLKPHDLISDYFVDVIVLAGDFTDYNSLKNDPILGEFFDERGLISSELQRFLNKSEVPVVRNFQGCIIPNFLDRDGSPKSIDVIVNSGIDGHGLMCAIDTKQLQAFNNGTNVKNIDLVGHSLIDGNISEINTLSYKRKTAEILDVDYVFDTVEQLDTASWNITYNPTNIVVQIPASVPYFAQLGDLITEDTLFSGETTPLGLNQGIIYSNPSLRVSNISSTQSEFTFTLSNFLKESETSGSFVDLAIRTPIAEANADAMIDLDGISAPTGGDLFEIEVESDTSVISVASFQATGGESASDIASGLEAGLFNAVTNFSISASGSELTFVYDGSNKTAMNGASAKIKLNGAILSSYVEDFLNGQDEVTAGAEIRTPKQVARTTPQTLIAKEGSEMYSLWSQGLLKTGDKIKNSSTEAFVSISAIRDLSTFENTIEIEFFADQDFNTQIPVILPNEGFLVDSGTAQIVTALPSISRNITCSPISSKTVRVDFADVEDVSVGEHVIGKDANGNKILTRIVEMVNVGSPVTNVDITTEEEIFVADQLNGDKTITHFIPFENMFDRFNLFKLKGLEVKETHKPNGTNSRMREIVGVMADSQMRKALVDPEMISFRYIVDTFNNGLERNQKHYISSIAKEGRRAMAILNMPSTEEYLDSVDPVFTDDPTPENPVPSLNAKYIAEGGNKSKNPLFLAVRPSEDQGASYGLWFYPNFNELEDDTSTTSVPPAAHVSNNYVVKWRNNEGFQATAGKFRGVINDPRVVGLDHMLDKTERGELETKGINPIREKNGEFQIFGNQTGYHRFKSVLNRANSRDTLISIEIGIENILDDYIFDDAFGDDITRTTIQTSVENFLESIQNLGGIDRFEVRFDRKNNPDFVLQEDASIIDVEVELAGVTRKFISRITLVGGDVNVSSFAAV